jgi:hypothetical protein
MRAQAAQAQRSEEATQECLISLKLELGALHEQAARLGEEAKRVKRLVEQAQKAEAATQQALSSLRGDVMALRQDLTQTRS